MNRSGHHATSVLTMSVPITLGITHSSPWSVIIASVIGCCWGVTAPDDVEIRYTTDSETERNEDGSETQVSKTLLAHRGVSHDVLIWLCLLAGSYWWLFISPFALTTWYQPLLKGVLFGVTYGAIIHLLADLPNGKGIPLFPFGPRVCLHLWKASENQALMCFLLFIATTALSVKIGMGYFELSMDWLITMKHQILLHAEHFSQFLINSADQINLLFHTYIPDLPR